VTLAAAFDLAAATAFLFVPDRVSETVALPTPSPFAFVWRRAAAAVC